MQCTLIFSKYTLMLLIYKQTRGGIAVGETKDDSKQFKYDFSYWSVHPTDAHYVSQEQVSVKQEHIA